MGALLRIVGVRHYDRNSLQRLIALVDSIGDAKKGGHLFLLEYNEKSFERDSRRQGGILRARPHETYALTALLKERGFSYRFIDTFALEAKAEFMRKLGWKGFLMFLFHRRDPRRIGDASPAFEEFLLRREQRMAEEILSALRDGIFKNIIVIVGEDHKERLHALLKKRLPDNVRTTVE